MVHQKGMKDNQHRPGHDAHIDFTDKDIGKGIQEQMDTIGHQKIQYVDKQVFPSFEWTAIEEKGDAEAKDDVAENEVPSISEMASEGNEIIKHKYIKGFQFFHLNILLKKTESARNVQTDNIQNNKETHQNFTIQHKNYVFELKICQTHFVPKKCHFVLAYNPKGVTNTLLVPFPLIKKSGMISFFAVAQTKPLRSRGHGRNSRKETYEK